MKKICLVFGLMIVLVTNAHGFDGKSEGPLLGFGVGGHITTFENEYSNSTYFRAADDIDSDGGLSTSLRLGWGVSEKMFIYAVNEANWASYGSKKDRYALGMTGAGLMWYFDTKDRPQYLSFAIGSPFLINTTGKDDSNIFDDGLGMQTGFGIEIAKWTNLELNYGVYAAKYLDGNASSFIQYFRMTLQFNFF